jgi:hypothetical protein
MKIWAKLYIKNDIAKDLIYESNLEMSYENYQKWLQDICNLLDIPNPVVIPYHYKNFVYFHNTLFKEDDFVQSLNYEKFRIEDCNED